MKTLLKVFAQKCIAVCAVLMLTMAPFAAHAQFQLFPDEPTGIEVDYRNYIRAFYSFSIGAGILIATVLIMVGGIMWVTSAGNPSRIDKAKDYITDSIIGVVLLIAAYTILQVINPNLVNLTLPKFPEFGNTGACLYAVKNAAGKMKCAVSTPALCTELRKTAENNKADFFEGSPCEEHCARVDDLGFCVGLDAFRQELQEQRQQEWQASTASGKGPRQVACEQRDDFGRGYLIPEGTIPWSTDSGECDRHCAGAGTTCVQSRHVDNDEGPNGDQIRCWCRFTGTAGQ